MDARYSVEGAAAVPWSEVFRVATSTAWAFGKNAYTHTRHQF